MMKSCAKWKMTKFDIFVVNLGRSLDRREAMRRKIARIRGFGEIYIDGERVNPLVDSTHGNLSWGMRFRTCENFGESTDSSLVFSPKFSQIQKPHRHYFD